MSNVRSGHQFERDVLRIFKEAGFDCLRCAASKGKLAGLDVDVVCSKTTQQGTKYEVGVVLMQMKRTSKRK